MSKMSLYTVKPITLTTSKIVLMIERIEIRKTEPSALRRIGIIGTTTPENPFRVIARVQSGSLPGDEIPQRPTTPHKPNQS